MVLWIQLELFIQPFLPCGYIVCLVMVAAGGYYSAGVLRGARGGGSCIVGWWEALSLWSRGAWGATVATGESGGPAQCRGRKVEPRLLRGPAQRTTHNTRLQILRTRQNTAAHTEQHTQIGGGSVAAAVHQLAAYMSDQTRRQLTNIGEDKHTSSKTLSPNQYARGCTYS